jgi:hypothetical protein
LGGCMKLNKGIMLILVFLSSAQGAFQDVIQSVIQKGRDERQVAIDDSFDKAAALAQANKRTLSNKELKKLNDLLSEQADLVYDAYFSPQGLFRKAMERLARNNNVLEIFSSADRLEKAVQSLDEQDSDYRNLKERVLNEVSEKYELLDERIKILTGPETVTELRMPSSKTIGGIGGLFVGLFFAVRYRLDMMRWAQRLLKNDEKSGQRGLKRFIFRQPQASAGGVPGGSEEAAEVLTQKTQVPIISRVIAFLLSLLPEDSQIEFYKVKLYNSLARALELQLPEKISLKELSSFIGEKIDEITKDPSKIEDDQVPTALEGVRYLMDQIKDIKGEAQKLFKGVDSSVEIVIGKLFGLAKVLSDRNRSMFDRDNLYKPLAKILELELPEEGLRSFIVESIDKILDGSVEIPDSRLFQVREEVQSLLDTIENNRKKDAFLKVVDSDFSVVIGKLNGLVTFLKKKESGRNKGHDNDVSQAPQKEKALLNENDVFKRFLENYNYFVGRIQGSTSEDKIKSIRGSQLDYINKSRLELLQISNLYEQAKSQFGGDPSSQEILKAYELNERLLKELSKQRVLKSGPSFAHQKLHERLIRTSDNRWSDTITPIKLGSFVPLAEGSFAYDSSPESKKQERKAFGDVLNKADEKMKKELNELRVVNEELIIPSDDPREVLETLKEWWKQVFDRIRESEKYGIYEKDIRGAIANKNNEEPVVKVLRNYESFVKNIKSGFDDKMSYIKTLEMVNLILAVEGLYKMLEEEIKLLETTRDTRLRISEDLMKRLDASDSNITWRNINSLKQLENFINGKIDEIVEYYPQAIR